MSKTYVLITDAHRARCFERRSGEPSLQELADFVFPQQHASTAGGRGDLTGEAGKGHGRSGHAGTQFEPRTDLHAKERGSFARELADYLNQAVAAQRCDELVVVATKPMLGELRPCLSPAAAKALKRCIAGDLTHFTGPELTRRVTESLQRTD